MKTKLIAQSVVSVLATGMLMAMSSALMAQSVQSVNPFDMDEMATSNLVMSGDHDHNHGGDSDKESADKYGDGKSKEKKEGSKTEGKCGADHQKKNGGKCGGH